MHDSVMDFLKREIKPSEIAGKTVLEVGSQNVNGTPRTIIGPMKPSSYVGVDFAKASGVDVVCDVKDLVAKFGADRFDVVISTEMLEHAQDWKTAVNQMKAVLKPGGFMAITTRGPGFPYHGYPHDYWRFTTQAFEAIFSDMDILRLEPDLSHNPGVLMTARKRLQHSQKDLSAISVAPIQKPA